MGYQSNGYKIVSDVDVARLRLAELAAQGDNRFHPLASSHQPSQSLMRRFRDQMGSEFESHPSDPDRFRCIGDPQAIIRRVSGRIHKYQPPGLVLTR